MSLAHRAFLISSGIGASIGIIVIFKEFVVGDQYTSDVKLEGKTVVITGANTGIGKQTALELAKRGARVILACRDLTLCEKARKEIVLETLNKHVVCRKCDLASLASIKEFADRINADEPNLHILINNAGVMRCPRTLTEDGFEMQLGVNHLGHFYLTHLLLDKLKQSAPSRIVNVSSVAHARGRINFDDLNSDKSYDPGEAYNQSKLANVLFTKELASRLTDTGVTTYAVHPGIVNTEIFRHMGFYNSIFSNIFLGPMIWLFAKSPRQGAKTTIYCSIDETLEKETGKYYSNCNNKRPSEEAQDSTAAKRLWAISEKWTRLVK